MTARWGEPQRRQVVAEVSHTAPTPHDDLALLVERRTSRGDISAPSPSTDSPSLVETLLVRRASRASADLNEETA